MSDENKEWASVLEFDISALNPAGVCRSPVSRAVNVALGLPGRATVSVSGQRVPGSDNFVSGTLSVYLEIAPTAAQIEAIRVGLVAANPCNDDDANRRVRINDLKDLAKESREGETVYVVNLPRLVGGSGCLVYKGKNGTWFRVSNDTEVIT